MKSNICIVCLNKTFAKVVAKHFADSMEMFYADVDDLIEYDLIDIAKAERVCGVEYISKIERNQVKNVCSYDNTCYTLNYTMLNDKSNFDLINKTSLIIFINLDINEYVSLQPKDREFESVNMLNEEMFEVRKNLIKDKADIVVDCDTLEIEALTNKIEQAIVYYYKEK